MQFHRVCVHWGLQWGWHVHDRVLTKLKTCVDMSNVSGVRSGRAPAPAGCLCSPYAPAAFHWHRLRRERHNCYVWAFRYCKYFFSCQLPSLPALASHRGAESGWMKAETFLSGGKRPVVSALIILTEVKLIINIWRWRWNEHRPEKNRGNCCSAVDENKWLRRSSRAWEMDFCYGWGKIWCRCSGMSPLCPAKTDLETLRGNLCVLGTNNNLLKGSHIWSDGRGRG